MQRMSNQQTEDGTNKRQHLHPDGQRKIKRVSSQKQKIKGHTYKLRDKTRMRSAE